MNFDRLALAPFLSLFFFVGTAFAQAPPPPASPDYDPKGWKEFSYPRDNVRFRLAAEPRFVDETKADAKATTHTYQRDSFMSFRLMVLTYAPNVDLESQAEPLGLMEKMRNAGIANIKNLNPVVYGETDVTVDGHPGRFFVVETNDGVLTRFKFFIVKNQVFLAWTGVKKGEKHGINWQNNFELSAMAFLDSVRSIANK